MERDIRDLFKDEGFDIELPKNHKEEFKEKLEFQNNKKRIFKKPLVFKIASAIIILFSISFYFFLDKNSKIESNENNLQAQVKAIEKEYLTQIDSEWQQFLAISNDSILIKKYEKKLKNFDKEYLQITNQLKEAPNSINILEALIINLQRRLELIKDVKEHIKELNQKNTSNETIYL